MAFKIIHTADWHFGQSFKQRSRVEEHQLFIHWLVQFIETENIDAVIIAGDIFDTPNPSIEALDLYYKFLEKTIQLNVQVIIIGGNHDSASRLNTTSNLLHLLNIHVIGGDANHLEKIIPLKNSKTQEIETVIVAVPYLRDADLRKISENESISDNEHTFSNNVKLHYNQLLYEAKSLYPQVPIIATGHLYITGSSLSDEKETNLHQIGTLGYIPANSFASDYAYIALGHIHKPQYIKHPNPNTIIKYAGSPIPLSFSERDDDKEISILNIENEKINLQTQAIPKFRNLKRMVGNKEEILNAIKNLEIKYDLTSWIEIVASEHLDFQDFNRELEELSKEISFEILSRQIAIKQTEANNIRAKYIIGSDQNPLDNINDIFKLKCQKSGLNEDNINLLIPLFEQAKVASIASKLDSL